MDAANASIRTAARNPGLSVDLDAALQVVVRSDARRSGLERFIADSFARVYDARITHFADQLAGLPRADGSWAAGVGYTPAGSTPLFIEQYLDSPVEDAIAGHLGVSVDRAQVVEVGNLAATAPGAARRLIVRMTALLHRLEYTWVVFTSTRALLNSFARLNMKPIVLGAADPERLAGGVGPWGSYYASEPQVMAGSIPIGYIRLLSGRWYEQGG